MPRPIALLVLLLSAILGGEGLLRPSWALEPWETQPYAEVPTTSSALQRMAPAAPPQRPLQTQRPSSWPSSAPAQTTPSETSSGLGANSYPTTNYPATNYPTTSPTTQSWPQTTPPAVTAPPGAHVPQEVARAAPPSAMIGPGVPEAQLDAGSGIVAKLELCQGAQPMALVGGEWILLGEVYDSVNGLLAQHPKEVGRLTPEQLEMERRRAIPSALQSLIEVKLIYLDAKRHLPAENIPKIEEKVSEMFESYWVPHMLEATQLSSRLELETKLQSLGTSLTHQRKLYTEQALAGRWKEAQTADLTPISRAELIAYYEAHRQDYEYAEQVRWQQLMVRFSDSTKQAAWATLADMGNQVLNGVPFADVAKARSQGPTAANGGVWSWTSRGSLVSSVLDQAIFTLPVGKLSQIVEDKQGLHIVQVLERKQAGRIPFEEVQHDIHKTLVKQQEAEKLKEYVAKLRKEIPVWTVFDKAEGNPLAMRPNAGAMQR